MNPRMPPLPEPYGYFDIRGEAADGFTADQLLSAQRAAWNAAMEAAAEACEERAGTVSMFANSREASANNHAVRGCASAIRSLKESDHE